MPVREELTSAPAAPADTAAAVLAIARTLAGELQPGRPGLERLDLDSSLDRDLGLDSLGRFELASRLERAFGVALPERLLAAAETPRDLLAGLLAASPRAVAEAAPTVALPEPGAPEVFPERASTLPEVLAWHAREHPGRLHVAFLAGEEGAAPEELSYRALAERARAVALALRGLGLAPGATVGLMLPSGLEYFVAFLGAQLAGGVPVPLYPPARRGQIADHLRRQAGILGTARAGLLVTSPEVLPFARLLSARLPELERVVTPAELEPAAGGPEGEEELPAVAGSDVAFLQFTSGSTGDPKGVVLTHANLLANLRAIGRAVVIRGDDVVVSWLPLYHDMGLIGAWMGSLYYGMPLILLSPLSFLARPARWLHAISRYRATISAAPNFAYELCVTKLPDEDLAGVDLASWRIAMNGAETVSPETVRRFAERFASRGFRTQAMMPVYGLAECSLGLTFPPPGRGPLVDAVRREPFQRTGRALPAAPGDPHALRFVSCGLPLPGHEVRIVDAAGNEAAERQEGRLEFLGPSATAGYYRNPEATRRLFREGGWLDSGDLGYVAGGEVYVTGRVKDVILRAGRNLYPQELEEAAGTVLGVRKGCVAVFGSLDPATGTERVVIVAETRETGREARERLRAALQETALDLLGMPADEVVLAPPHAVPKTSSGKLRRAAARELYERGRLGRRAGPPAWQVATLLLATARPRLARKAHAAAGLLYAGWAWAVFGLLAVPVWLAVAATPGLARRRRLARGAARLLAFLTGTSVEVAGIEHLAGAGPCVLAANHASFLDAYALSAALPPAVAYVAKREFEERFLSRVFLRRLGAVFVERFDPSRGMAEAQKVLAAVRGGESVLFFPEGTFGRAPGLRPFHLGAFAVAAEAGVPVVPVAIRGTRSMLRGEEYFPRRGAVAVAVRPPVAPSGSGWAAAVALRDAARREILAHCGEPELR